MFTSIVASLLSAMAPAAVAAPERNVEIAGPKGPLAGTLRGTAAPVVLIIPGSGPTDRDGDNPLGVKAAPYRLLAQALGERGITTLRIDKRGMFGSKAAIADGNDVKIADYAADAHAWAAEARRLTGARCVWLAGHSEGSLVALLAGQDPKDLCGIISIAGAGRRFSVLMREQLRANPGNAPILEPALAAIDTLEKGGTVDAEALPKPLLALFSPSLQPYLRDLFSHDPVQLAAQLKLPLLIIQGGRDLQVRTEDADLLHAAQPSSTITIIPEANHVLKVVPVDDPTANFASYGEEDKPLAPGIAEAIAAFVGKTDR